MSEQPIQVGDLVVQVRACCSNEANRSRAFGVPFVVRKVSVSGGICRACGGRWEVINRALGDKHHDSVWTAWLKRIPPLAERESETKRESIHA